MGCGWALSALRGLVRPLCDLGSRGYAEMEVWLLMLLIMSPISGFDLLVRRGPVSLMFFTRFGSSVSHVGI